MTPSSLTKTATALLALTFIAGCNSEKSEFVDQCTEKGRDKSFCKCEYDFYEDTLSEPEMETMMTISIGSEEEQKKLQAKLGFVTALALLGRLGIVESQAKSFCEAS